MPSSGSEGGMTGLPYICTEDGTVIVSYSEKGSEATGE